uniref:U5 small nuclear ribonucleoprotein 40 kDa protein isoform X2 n=1 Tax=Erigeron canadensis TaxID=72917 RepID=UPI001CB92C77|nr:U5 small nuclear ribonucleoprotein 40 kDa protein isoform X2 [Erigeron canadensis]
MDSGDEKTDREEQEEALIALIEHRAKEVDHLRTRVAYYTSELKESEKRLEETQRKLARLRGRGNAVESTNVSQNGVKVKEERRSSSPVRISQHTLSNHGERDSGNSSKSYIPDHHRNAKHENRPKLVIPAIKPKSSAPIKMAESGSKSVSKYDRSIVTEKGNRIPPELENVDAQSRGTKRKFEQREHKDLIQMVCNSSSSHTINCQTSNHIPSQHKRKLRSLALCPTNDQLFVTSALDGLVNLWEINARGSSATLLSTADCGSDKNRRWPEDIAWHPHGGSLFSVYSADGGDSQIGVLNLNKGKKKNRVTFLEDKPHIKGIINNIAFMPWEDVCFVTGGSDHAVVQWTDKHGEDYWKPKVLHRSMHSSAVMGVAGMQQKQMVVSVGADKRIIGFDLQTGRADYKHQIESKCMSVLPNPCDFNLFMVQTSTPERQLRLFDIRLRQTEIHEFGWKQESSESQSALINQAWSPDGFYLTSGSADPMFHIFDIRFNANKPSQSIKAHQKRVFKAAWHHTLPLLISISSDLNIGLHKIA